MASVWADAGPGAQPSGAEQPTRAARQRSLTEVDEDELEDEEPSQHAHGLSGGGGGPVESREGGEGHGGG